MILNTQFITALNYMETVQWRCGTMKGNRIRCQDFSRTSAPVQGDLNLIAPVECLCSLWQLSRIRMSPCTVGCLEESRGSYYSLFRQVSMSFEKLLLLWGSSKCRHWYILRREEKMKPCAYQTRSKYHVISTVFLSPCLYTL